MIAPPAIGWTIDKKYRQPQLHWTLFGVVVSFALWGACFPTHE
jgi:hypothetical protein